MKTTSFRLVCRAAACFLAGVILENCDGAQVAAGSGKVDGDSGNTGGPAFKLDGSAVGAGGFGGGGTTDAEPPTSDANCGSITNSATPMPSDVLLVLDRSGSMSDSLTADVSCSGGTGGSNCAARWPALTSAVNTTVTASTSINWGLKFFASPSGGTCGVLSGVDVPISANSAADIANQIGKTSPGNNTPTASAITTATAYLKTINDPNNKFILLATDGEPNCKVGASPDVPDLQGALDAIAAAKADGFLVYVIGIGPSVGDLDNMAQAGGTTHYFPASSAADLSAALATIAKAVASCTFISAAPPPDPNDIAVYLGGAQVPKDVNNGWALSPPKTVTLTGSYCDRVRSDPSSKVQVLFGCPNVPIL